MIQPIFILLGRNSSDFCVGFWKIEDTKNVIQKLTDLYIYMILWAHLRKNRGYAHALCDIWYGNWQRNENKKRSICAKFMNTY